jgi:hypothetical protein
MEVRPSPNQVQGRHTDILPFPRDLGQDLSVFRVDYIHVGSLCAAVQSNQGALSLLVPSNHGEVSGAVRKQEHASEKHDSGNDLDSQRDTPLSVTAREAVQLGPQIDGS